MIQKHILLSLALVATGAFAQTISGQFDCLPAGQYTLCQNLWGIRTFVHLAMSAAYRYSDGS